MDEYHNLIAPKDHVLRYKDKLIALRKMLRKADNAIIVGATATPIINGSTKAIVEEIKGEKYKHSATNEGFVSYFMSLPSSIYPRVDPGPPDIVLPYIVQVPICGENLKRYDKEIKAKTGMVKMRNYENMSTSYGFRKGFAAKLHVAPYSHATKLSAIAAYILADKRKILVLQDRSTGFRALEEIMEYTARDMKYPCVNGECWAAMYDDTTENTRIRNLFNHKSNNKGQKLRIIIADGKTFAEGVSFKSVQLILLVDVPKNIIEYEQYIGRVLRSCVYQSQVPKADQKVRVEICVSIHPDQKVVTADQYYLKLLKDAQVKNHKLLVDLEKDSIDKAVLAPLIGAGGVDYPVNMHPETRVLRIPKGSIPAADVVRVRQPGVGDLRMRCAELQIKIPPKSKKSEIVQLLEAKLGLKISGKPGSIRTKREEGVYDDLRVEKAFYHRFKKDESPRVETCLQIS